MFEYRSLVLSDIFECVVMLSVYMCIHSLIEQAVRSLSQVPNTALDKALNSACWVIFRAFVVVC